MPSEEPLGGYLPLETFHATARPLPEGLALASGRACVAAVLRHMRPERLWVPHYICDSAYAAANELGVEVAHYAIGPDMLPQGPPDPGNGRDMLLVVDYFGLLGPALDPLLQAWGDRALLDRSQAFFAPAAPGVWSFVSTRKFFGVPDGAFLTGPQQLAPPTQANARYAMDHLVLAAWGHQQEGLAAYRANNALMSTAYQGMSTVTRRILEHADTTMNAGRRRENFMALHALLGDVNTYPVSAAPASAPLHYPFLPSNPVALERFHGAGIFAPRLWPEVLQRTGTPDRERRLAGGLIPLPIDQRYGVEHMEQLAWRTRKLV